MQANTEQEKKRSSIFASTSLMSELDRVGNQLGYKTRTRTLQFLTRFYDETQHSSEGLPVATFDTISKTNAPVCICGIPGSGKSFALDVFLKECKKKSLPFLLFNSDSRDHDWINNELQWSDVVGLRWLDSPGQYIVRLPHDLQMRKTTMSQISQSILRLEGDPKLELWTLIFEEAHDFHKLESFDSILRRMRKSVRKLIVVSTEAELFKMCRAFRPIPFE